MSKKDFLKHMRISRKEAKESRFWLRLLDTKSDLASENERQALIQEVSELLRILTAMIQIRNVLHTDEHVFFGFSAWDLLPCKHPKHFMNTLRGCTAFFLQQVQIRVQRGGEA
jgi:hypothetical protein